MKKNQAKTVSARIKFEEFAKARDGMIARGVDPERLQSNSAILKTAILMCCLLNDDPKGPSSTESTNLIKQLWRTTKHAKNIDLDNLY